MRTKYAWALGILATIAASSCSCNTKPLQIGSAFLQVVEGSATDFQQICLDGHADKTLTIRNNGNAPAKVSWKVLPVIAGAEGDVAAKMFDTVPPQGQAVNIVGLSAQKITVTYHPNDADAGGASQLNKPHAAFLHFTSDSTDPKSKEFEVKLDGRTSGQQPVAIGTFTCNDKDVICGAGGTSGCCSQILGVKDPPDLNRTRVNLLNFHAVPTGASRSLKVDLANLGCGELHISGYNFVSDGASFCPSSNIKVDGMSQPLSIPGSVTGEGGTPTTVSVVFTPAGECTLSGKLVLTTDDPNIDPEKSGQDYASINLQGSGAKPEVTAVCGSPPLQNTCNYPNIATGECGTLELHLANHGTIPVTVSSDDIEPGGPGATEYTVEKVEKAVCGSGARAAVTVPFDLSPSDSMSNCGDDEAYATVNYCPGSKPDNQRNPDDDYLVFVYTEEGGGGEVRVHLHGGSPPGMVVTPEIGDHECKADRGTTDITGAALAFVTPENVGCGACDASCQGSCTGDGDCTNGDGPCIAGQCAGALGCVGGLCGQIGAKPVQICNTGEGNLIIDQLEFVDDAGDPTTFFSPLQDGCTGTTMKKGECCTFQVTAKTDNVGGVRGGEVKIHSNDPAYPEPDGDPVIFCSNVPTHLHPAVNFDSTDGMGGDVANAMEWFYVDPTPTIITPPTGTLENFVWSLKAVPSGVNSRMPLGIIDPASPNARCPELIKDCFQFPTTVNGQPVSPPNKILGIRADLAGDYTVHVKLDDGICSPPFDNEDGSDNGDFVVHVK